MKGPLVWVGLLCLAPLCLALTYQEDDLVFDDVGEETPTLNAEASSQSPLADKPTKKHQRVEKLLGLPDAVAATGHVFKLHVPKQAFTGSIDFYEASGANGRGLPHWLRWEEPASALYGVPSRKDIGRHRVNIKAFGKHGDVAQDSFIIHVVPEKNEHFKHKDGKKRCTEEQDRTMLTLLVDARYENLKPSAKVNALENLAGFLGLHTNSISIQPDVSKDNLDGSAGTSVVLSGPGNVARRHEKHSTLVQWQVGCDGHFWPHQIDMIKQIPEQARDGTLSEVTQLPVYQWRVRSDANDYSRNRRDTAGSGFLPDGDEEDDAEYEEGEDADYDDDYDGEGVTETPQEPKQKAVVHPSGGNAVEHPHRHHHGEDSVAGINSGPFDEDDEIFWRNADVNNALFNATSPTTTTSTTPSTTIAAIIPSSTTTSTTTTTTTEPSTTPSSTTTEWTTTSTTSTTTEEPTSPSESITASTTTSTTTQAIASATAEILTTTDTSSSIYTNLTFMVTGSSNSSANATIDSLTVDGEEVLPTEREIDAEIDEDETTITTQEPSVFVASEATTPSSGQFTSQSVVEVAATLEPNATSVFTVNASTEEYEEGQAPGREDSISSSTTGYLSPWGENSTEKVPGEFLDPYTIYRSSFNSTPSTTTSTTTPSTTTITTTEPTTSSPMSPTTSSTTTTTPSTTTSTTPEPTTPSTTTTTTTTTSTPLTSSTTLSTTTNSVPEVRRRLKKLAVMQGKVLTYTIPDDTFSDTEDGNTRQLRVKMYDNGAPIKPTYWFQFNEQTHEVYGLPLEHDIGSYAFEVEAIDSQGASAKVGLDVTVQQYKQIRAVNHQFHLYLKIVKRSEFPSIVDWELKVMRNLAELYGDHDLNYITVRSIDIFPDNNNQVIFSWTNDSLLRSSVCPQREIDRLYNYLVSPGKEYPSEELIRVLGPEIKPTRVLFEGLEQCQKVIETVINTNPVPRNQIDRLNATVGQLFIFRVPKDTFFDLEDGDTRYLQASMLTSNRTPVPSWDWLQFDPRNQEFFGVPLAQDFGCKTYQLVVKDKGGLEATDSLDANVNSAPDVRHPVEILMKLSMPADTFVNSALKKREFIEKLQKLYGDKNSSAISLLSISGNREATVVTWSNLSLPTNECPQDEIMRLFRVLVKDDKNFTDELYREFNNNIQQPDFNVMQISVKQTNACKDQIGAGGPQVPTIDDSTAVGASHDDYLITFVLPAIIIAAMLTLAGIIACILYKRRRSGKMSVSEKDDERQSFRSKGIPVIFQDELDEKPDPGNKSPIILKEEKPPLPPPEYQRAEDGADIPMLSKENSEEPYQPPPPFATNRDSNRQNRPKPTPTYRKPPPYVPP